MRASAGLSSGEGTYLAAGPIASRISPFKDAKGRCNGSNRRSQPSAFSPFTRAAYNIFNVQRHLITRPVLRLFRAEAITNWNTATAA